MQFTRRRVLAGMMALAIGGVVATADTRKPAPIDPAHQLVPAPITPASARLPEAPLPPINYLPAPVKVELPATPEPVKPSRVELPSAVPPPPPRKVEVEVIPLPTPRKVEPVVRKGDLKTSNVKVVLLLGDAQPKFDVYCGDDAVLKVSCDKVDVRSPAENAAMTPLKGAGHVSFTLPGYTGTCDEIIVMANTGEITISGNVKLVCKSGKVESEIHATTVRFRLSAASATSAIGPASSNVNLETLNP